MTSLAIVIAAAGCASTEKQIQKVAKDWCMTVRGSQVIPVYPLTEDAQPGDVFLVQVPVDRQQEIYKRKGFLPLDNHIARIDPSGYADFYDHSFLGSNATNILPRDWIRPGGPGLYRGTNGTNTLSWQAAPHAAFPSYSFSVRNGAGLSLAVPVSGVPVGLSLLASDAASGSLQISDSRTLGVDTISLYRQLRNWASTNSDFLHYFGGGLTNAKPNYLRVITRVYAAGRMMVTLKDASNRSAGLDAGVPKPVNLLLPELPNGSNTTAENAVKNYTNAWNAMSEMVKAAGAIATNASGVLPGGSLRLAAASSRTVSLDETFDPPVIFGYLGFDCAIFKGGVLGPPIPTYAVLDPSYNLAGLLQLSPVYGQLLDKALYGILTADPANPRAQNARKQLDALAAYVPNEFTEYSGPSGTPPVLTATLLKGDSLHNTNFPAYYAFHGFRAALDESFIALQGALGLKSFQLKDAAGQMQNVDPSSPAWRDLENALAYYSNLRQRSSDDANVQSAYSEAYAYYLEKILR
jgi:hypothetical protein